VALELQPCSKALILARVEHTKSANPPELTRLLISCLPSLGEHLMVICVGAPPYNELRVIRASAISCTKARVTGDDDFVTFDHDEYASLLFQNS
jgi:hypothetical protein